MQQTSVSPDQFKISHLKGRLATIVADYEEQLADEVVQKQFYIQRCQELEQLLQSMQPVEETETGAGIELVKDDEPEGGEPTE